ncbi:MAG: PEP-CTERM sorting domain-containing protein [Pirellulales bacterium]|nr:PEP-CTERM sorting domain-containing protein [Pirellulales bacterium]
MRCHIHFASAALILATLLLGSLWTTSVQAEAILVGYWNLDETSGTTAADSATPPASDGSVTGATWTTGHLNGGLSFDATGERVDMGLGGSNELALTGDLSLDFWMKPAGIGGAKYGALVGINVSGGSNNDGYFTDIVYTDSVLGGGGVAAGTIEFGVTYYDTGAALYKNFVLRSATALANDNTTWYHIQAVYDAGNRMAIYIDGDLDAEVTTGVPAAIDYANNPAKPVSSFSLGNLGAASTVHTYYFNGTLDEVRVFSGAVPEPGCLVLLGSLLGFALIRRK